MKQIFLLIALILTFSTIASGKVSGQITISQDSAQNTAIVVSSDSMGVDTIIADSDTAEDEDIDDVESFGYEGFQNIGEAILIPIVAIVFTLGMPILILFIIFFFRYKNKKAQYALVAKSLEAGQPIPEGMFDKKLENKDLMSKGIKNTCLGLGLFVFLWAITDEFGIGCIGLLIMLSGIGQIIIHRVNHPMGCKEDIKATETPTVTIVEEEKKSTEE
ncbi:MAG: DUF6249 domain-containing protein [Bacteroides sp.]